MRCPTLVCVIALITPTFGAPRVGVQDEIVREKAVAGYDASGTMFRIRRMLDPKEVSECSRSIRIGNVVSVERSDENEIVSFLLRGRHKDHEIRLPKSLYPVKKSLKGHLSQKLC
jgi:hypothetical protein